MKNILIVCLSFIIVINAFSYEVQNDSTWAAYDFYNEPIEKFLDLEADNAFRVLNIWGNTLEEAKRYAKDAKPFIDILYENRIKTSAMFGGISISSKDDFNFIDVAAARNPIGKITGVDSNVLHGCYNREEWRKRIYDYFNIFANLHIDYVEMDQPAQEHWRGECYCDKCNKGFTEYLKEKNIIGKEVSFDYVQFLRKNGMAFMNEGDREIKSPYGKYYWEYQIEKDKKNISEISRFFLDKHDNMEFFGNTWGLAGEYLPGVTFYDHIDVAGDFRTPWLWEPPKERFGPPYNSWVPVIKIAVSMAKGRKVLSFLDTYPFDRILKDYPYKKDDILNIYAAESLASGAEFVFPYSNRVAYENKNRFSSGNIEDFLKFIKRNHIIFSRRESNVKVLVTGKLHDFILKRFYKQYWAISYYLMDKGIDYDFSFEKDLNSMNLKKYDLIIDSSKYSENIFNYVYNKEEKFILPVKEIIKDININIETDLKSYRRFDYVDRFGRNYIHVVNTSLDNEEIVNIFFKDVSKINKVVTFPNSNNIVSVKENGVNISFSGKSKYIIVIY